MNWAKPTRGVVVAIVFAIAPYVSAQEPLSQITACVEPTAEVANNFSAKRRSTRTDCDASVAFQRARAQSGINARDAIVSTCRDRVSRAEAEATCRSRGLSLPTSPTTSLGRSPLVAQGRPAANASLPILSQSPKLCAILRNVPNETETSTQPAGIENGFCLFNGNKTTTKVVRTRAVCAVQCF
jgi:hypothetical protein